MVECFCFGIVLKTDFENNHKYSGFLLELLVFPLSIIVCLPGFNTQLYCTCEDASSRTSSIIICLYYFAWQQGDLASKRTWLTFRTCVDSYSSGTVNTWIFLWVAPGGDDLEPGPLWPHLGPYPCVPQGWCLVSVHFLDYLGLAAQIVLRLLISTLWRAVLFTIWMSFPIFVFWPFNVVLMTTKCNFFQIKINILKKALDMDSNPTWS